jgi:DNA-binding response OmpR family regulator
MTDAPFRTDDGPAAPVRRGPVDRINRAALPRRVHALMAADGAVVSAEELLSGVWDENADPFTNAVRITMSRLRAKLADPQVIETVAGGGYRLRRDG